MPSTPHVEQHFTGGLVVRDTVIGLADGLTVPFALAAGLTGAVYLNVDDARIKVPEGGYRLPTVEEGARLVSDLGSDPTPTW